MIKGYVCRSKNSDRITIAAPIKESNFKIPKIKEETGWFWHIPGWFYTMPIRAFKKAFGFSIKPGTYKLVNISIYARNRSKRRKNQTLLEAAQEILYDFNHYGEVLQVGDNGEYGTESAIGRLSAAVHELE